MSSVKFVQSGDAVDYTPEEDVAAGDVVVQGNLVGVAKLDIKAGKLGALAVAGVFDFPKATGSETGFDAGVPAYWNAENKRAIKTNSGGEPLIGKTVKAAADDDETVRVRLSQ